MGKRDEGEGFVEKLSENKDIEREFAGKVENIERAATICAAAMLRIFPLRQVALTFKASVLSQLSVNLHVFSSFPFCLILKELTAETNREKKNRG
jgi:hypothetical protein